MKKIHSVLALLFLLSACASGAPQMVKQDSDMGPKINLDVLTVVVLDRSTQLAGETPYTTNNFQPTMANAIRRWATDKLVAVGATGEATVVIKDASLISQPIPHPDSMFTREQTSKYVAHAVVELNVSRRNDHGEVIAEATQFVTLPEGPSTQERQNAYNKLLNSVMQDLTGNLRSGIKGHLGNFISGQSTSK